MKLNKFLFGDPLKTSNLDGETLSKIKALAIFSSDVLSSVAYATEEVLIVLGATLALSFALPISYIIAGLIAIVCTSYWQTIREYPNGGGAFSVAHENLGENMGLMAAASLMIDYTLTVAVSISAGTKAITSAFPTLIPYAVPICLGILLFLTIINLRGIRESAGFLAIPTYCFIFLMLTIIVIGLFSPAIEAPAFMAESNNVMSWAIMLVVLRAFASGCSALTGIEAIASGVPAFRKPRVKNAQMTLVLMACTLSTLFLGMAFLAHKFSILPSASESVISQIARITCGDGFWYYCIQLLTMLVLIMAANTSFSGFPRLASVLAKQKYIPTSFANLGDRLAFSNGIILLSVVSTLLIIAFSGDTHSLIPLYSLGVFISFTLSQAGMVRHCLRTHLDNWQLKAIISATGAATTFVALVIIIEAKFLEGAWVVLFLIPCIMYFCKKVNRQYKQNYRVLDAKNGGLGAILRAKALQETKAIVPVSRMHRCTLSALRFAKTLSPNVIAVMVNVNQKETDKLKLAWRAMNFQQPLVILESPYRSVINPFLSFVDEMDEENKPVIVVLPSFVPGQLWQNILHNQTATFIKTALIYKKNKSNNTRIIVDVPYKMVG